MQNPVGTEHVVEAWLAGYIYQWHVLVLCEEGDRSMYTTAVIFVMLLRRSAAGKFFGVLTDVGVGTELSSLQLLLWGGLLGDQYFTKRAGVTRGVVG